MEDGADGIAVAMYQATVSPAVGAVLTQHKTLEFQARSG